MQSTPSSIPTTDNSTGIRSPGPLTVDRVAGWHHAIVTTNNTRPNVCFMTYINETGNSGTQHLLAKLVIGVEIDGQIHWTSEAANVDVSDIPGGVIAAYNIKHVQVRTEILPLMKGRGAGRWEGAALFTVSTIPAKPVVLRIGGGREAFMHYNPVDWIVTDEVDFDGASVELVDGVGMLHSSKHPLAIGVVTSGELTREEGHLIARMGRGAGTVLLSFAKEGARAFELVKLEPDAERKQVVAYYDKLLSSCRLETPETEMNQAFRSALYNLEYNWAEPIGWVEGLHHWVTMWHQQHTPGVEWLGQADRSRQCIVTHAEKVPEDGAIPHMSPGGHVRRDWGGNNQFYLWQVRHYLRHTGDMETIRKIAPVVMRAAEQSFEEYDQDGDGLLCWGLQIGNQEDFVLTPFGGTSPTVEGINMLRTAALVAQVTGDPVKARHFEALAERSVARLRSDLWLKDLGRFGFYKDPLGPIALDGQYQTFIYPAIWGVLDAEDGWTSIRHLRDRLMGKGGEIYCSNNFPDHLIDLWATWGMQAGASQQPWGAWGLAKVGLRNETYRPLQALAEWVMSDFHKGAWPEVAHEKRLGYFSPPAGVYIQAVAEAVFGLEVDKLEHVIHVAPSFPDKWPKAKLTLPEYSAEYRRMGNTFHYVVSSAEELTRHVRWMLPVGAVSEVLVNGEEIAFEISPGVGCVVLEFRTPASKRTHLTVKMRPLKYVVTVPGSIAEGDLLVLKLEGARIESLDDRCGVLESYRMGTNHGVEARVRTGQLDKYKGYGRLGQLNFSRRTFFLNCHQKEVSFRLPVDLVILPRCEVTAQGEVEDGSVRLLIRNNTQTELAGAARLTVAGATVAWELEVAARSERFCSIALSATMVNQLTPGDNQSELRLPDGQRVDVTLSVVKQIAGNAVLLEHMRQRMKPVKLPQEALYKSDQWHALRKVMGSSRCLWDWSPSPRDCLDQPELVLPELPGVRFEMSDGLVVLSHKLGKPELLLDLESQEYRKLFLLVAGLADNHSMFLPIARLDLLLGKSKSANVGIQFISRTLRLPGDLDWWINTCMGGRLATFQPPRRDRLGLLPLLPASATDWREGEAPGFPQPEFWARSLAVKTPAAVLNVVELDLGKPMVLQSLRLVMESVDPALGLLAVTGYKGL